MNPATEPSLPPLAQPPRSSFSCDLHPLEQFTGFCPECLCERLAGLDKAASAPRKSIAGASTSSITAAAIKAVFRGDKTSNRNSTSSKPSSSFFAELRRTKSFSASKGERFSGVFEPQRKSCDVRARNTLWSLFGQDDARKKMTHFDGKEGGEIGDEVEDEVMGAREEVYDEIRVSVEAPNMVSPVFEDSVAEIVEEETLADAGTEQPSQIQEETEDLKPMKDHIDLDSQCKKPAGRDFKEIAGSFWSAASVFSKKLQKWRRKQKLKKQGNGSASAMLPVKKKLGRQCRETQSEIAEYGYGRRSCDTDPRFSLDVGRMSLDAGRMSLDAGRISFDDPRYSFDEPRVSWDGNLIGRASFPRLPSMLSVVEDAPVPVSRTDNQIPVEAAVPMNCSNYNEVIPGGSAQTRDYYSDSSSRRRKSLERSNSIRKTAAAVVAEIDEIKIASNAKVSPATTTIDHTHIPHRDSNSNSLRDDCSESLDTVIGSVNGNGNSKPPARKSRRWKVWNIWGLIYRRSSKDEDDVEDRFSSLNAVQRSFSESWRGVGNAGVLRSNSSVSSRNLHRGAFGSVRKSDNGHGKRLKEAYVLERNGSSNTSVDGGLLKFYLTPLRGSRRTDKNPSSIARSVLRFY